MIKGIYTSAGGMGVQQGVMDSVSNNLANASVPGYKKDRVVAVPFPEMIQLSNKLRNHVGLPQHRAIGTTNQGGAVQQVVTDFAPGILRDTGAATDYALTQPGFFTLQDPNSQQDDDIYYTRNGHFKLDLEGYLINDDGYRVVGTGGAIQIEAGQDFVVSGAGDIIVDGNVVNSFAIAVFDEEENMERTGYNMFTAPGQQPLLGDNPGIVQGFLEQANVNPADETVQMITAVRAYETGQRIIQAQDGMLDIAANKIGRIR